MKKKAEGTGRFIVSARLSMSTWISGVLSLVTLAVQQMRRVWKLFALVTLGMVAGVVLVGAVPLFALVNTTASTRQAFRNQSYDPSSYVQADVPLPDSRSIQRMIQQVEHDYQQHGQPFFHLPPEISVQVSITPSLEIHGYDMGDIASHLHIQQGRLPKAIADLPSNELEVAMTRSIADSFRLHVGSTFLIDAEGTDTIHQSLPTVPVSVRVVGILDNLSSTAFEDPFWHSDDLNMPPPQTPQAAHMIASNTTLLALLDRVLKANFGQPIQFGTGTKLYLYFPLDIDTISSENVAQLLRQVDYLSNTEPGLLNGGLSIDNVVIDNSNLSIPEAKVGSHVTVVEVPVLTLLGLMLGLILYFVAVMTELLVTRQAEAIAITRSRGATGGQIFVTFVIQSLLLGLLTVLIGPLLIPPVVRSLVGALFPGASQNALNVVPVTPWDTLRTLGWYAWVAVVMGVGTMCFSVWRTLKGSTLGRSTTQTIGVQRPLWQRLYADMLVALLGVLTYGLYTYLASTGNITPQLQVQLAGPCMLVAATLLCLAGALVFLRAFPWLVQLGARLMALGRGIVPLFSFVVMARAPRQAMRTALLLIFTIAFALFAQVFLATQQQRTVDLNAYGYVTAADFSGQLVQADTPTKTFVQQQEEYQRIPGVQSAALAFVSDEYFLNSGGSSTLTVIATDPGTFGTSITLPPVDAHTDVTAMLRHLADERGAIVTESDRIQAGANVELSGMPAIVSSATARLLHVSVGQTFFLTGVNYGGRLPLVDVGEVPYLPGVTDIAGDEGVLVDYTSFVAGYTTAITRGALLAPTNAWIQSKQDATSLLGVQHVLSSGPLALNPLFARHAMLTDAQHDPLYLNLVCTLGLGIVLTLLLAWIGCLSSAWLSVRARLRSLLALRALGATPGQLALLLAWEQGIIYATAIVLGVACGAGFIALALSKVIFTDTAQFNQLASAPALDPFQAQVLVPLQIVIPPMVLIGLGVVVLLCAVSIAMTAIMIARLSPGQMLRLSEDYVDEAPVAAGREEKRARVVRQESGQRGLWRETEVGRALTPVRRAWSTLGLIQLGVLISVLFVCVVPLFSQVAATAGLHDVLAVPDNRYAIATNTPSQTIPLGHVEAALSQATNVLNRTIYGQAGAYFHEAPIVSLENATIVRAGIQAPQTPIANTSLQFFGLSEQSLPGQVQVVQGTTPMAGVNGPLQIMLTAPAAAYLHLHVGERLTEAQGYPFAMQLVGIFQVRGGPNSLVTRNFFYDAQPGVQSSSIATALTATEELARAFDGSHLAQSAGNYALTGQVTWRYGIEQGITSAQLDDLVNRLGLLRLAQGVQPADTFTLSTIATPLSVLQQYQQSVVISSIPITCASGLIIALVLLFLSFMVDLLVERDGNTIAILCSRGASQRQVFAAFLKRMVLINGIGLIGGIALALPLVVLLTRVTLQPGDQFGLTYITAQPAQTLLGLAAFALASTAVTLCAIVVALAQATRTDYLSLRTELARATRKAFWQRWYLDVVGIVVALTAYGFSLYLTSAGIFDPAVEVQVKAPLVLMATISLALACMLLLLRLLPVLLRLGAMLAMRNRGVEAMLALSQMARAPRQRLRTTLLLMLSTAFVVFVVVFGASQNEHINDVAQYWAGADFGGTLPNQVLPSQAEQLEKRYRQVKGVTSVTLGSKATLEDAQGNKAAELLAVNLNNFVQTVNWPELSATDEQTLFKKLNNPLDFPSLADAWMNASGAVLPAVIDRQTAAMLSMGPGDTFTLGATEVGEINFFVVAVVPSIPTLNDQSGGTEAIAGILVDFQAYDLLQQDTSSGFMGPTVIQDALLNTIWLKTDGSERSMQNVRRVLEAGPLQLNAFYDREAMEQALVRDPLSLNLVGILILGTLAPLLLTWIGCLLASWLDVRQRQLLFSVLRALGSTSDQLARVLGWEQGLMFGTAVVLGTVFGLLTAFLALPSLVLTSVLPKVSTVGGGNFASSAQDLFALQNTPMAQTVVPAWLAAVVGLLALLAVVAMLMMTRSASRLALGQTLRLNED